MEKKYLYLIVAAVAAFISLAIILPLWQPQALIKNQQSSIVTGAAPAAPPEESIAPSIEDVSGRPGEGMSSSQKKPTSLAQVYSRYPAEGTGNNMAASWAKVSPEEKTKVIEQLNRKITEAKETLNINPTDKKAKHILFISETLKKMCKNNFKFKLLKTIPQGPSGLKSRDKK